jgi:hypothetical protein
VALTFQDVGACNCPAPTCQICVNVKTCAGVNQAGATVTISQGGATVGSPGTTDASGNYCQDVTATGSGTYNVATTLAGNVGSNKDVVVTCPGTTNVSLTVVATANKIRVHVNGCNAAALPGANVTVGGGSYSTDSSGNADFSLPAGSYSCTVSKSRFTSQTFTLTVSGCGGSTTSKTLAAATGYVCCAFGGAYSGPIPCADTLNTSDSAGAFTVPTVGGTVCHTGSQPNASVAGAAACDPFNHCHRNPNDLSSRTVAIQYTIFPCDLGTISGLGRVEIPGITYLAYFNGCNSSNFTCSSGTQRIARWLDATVGCPFTGGTSDFWSATSYVLNAPPPATSITINFDPGDGLWDILYPPGGAGPKGNPPSSSITLTE